MLPGCAVQVRDGVAQPDDGSDSIYFSVPSRRGAILQATFRAEYEPSTEEFMLLRWAAVAASVIVEYEDAAALSASVPEAPEAFVCNQWC
jgi:hypothetical protein